MRFFLFEIFRENSLTFQRRTFYWVKSGMNKYGNAIGIKIGERMIRKKFDYFAVFEKNRYDSVPLTTGKERRRTKRQSNCTSADIWWRDMR